MDVSALLTIIRTDYLYDTVEPYMWDDDSLLRKLTEAERQACNRGNLIYDDSTPAYTRIMLVTGQSSYAIDQKVTSIENIIFTGKLIEKKTKEQMDSLSSTWRTDSGMAGKTVSVVISGRKLRVYPAPDAVDAGGYIYLELYRLPDSEITSTSDEFEIPEENHRDLLYWVLHECYKKHMEDGAIFSQEKSDYNLVRFNEIFGFPVSAKVRAHQFESPSTLILSAASYQVSSQPTDADECW